MPDSDDKKKDVDKAAGSGIGYTPGNGLLLNLVSDIYYDLAQTDAAQRRLEKPFIMDPEGVMDLYGLSTSQKCLVFSWDRQRLAEAVAREIVQIDPYEPLKGTLWPGAHKTVKGIASIDGGLPATFKQGAASALLVTVVGFSLKEMPTFALVHLGKTIALPASKVTKGASGDVTSQDYVVSFDTRGLTPNDSFYVEVSDCSASVISPMTAQLVP